MSTLQPDDSASLQQPAGAARASAVRLARLTALYAAQGIPFGFATTYIPLQIATRPDFDYARATLMSLANFPWALKMIWAPLADTHYWPALGRRRSWILPAQAALVLASAAACGMDFAGPLLPLFALTALLNLFASMQDCAVDGLAVEMLPERERGLGNAAQVAGYKLGMVLGGSALVDVAARVGTQTAMLMLALFVAALMLVPAGYREPPPPPRAAEVRGSGPRALGLLWRTLRSGGWAPTLLFIATAKVGEAMFSALVRPYLVREAGWSVQEVAWLVGLGAMAASLAGSVAGGWLCGRMGRLRALAVFGSLQAVLLLAAGTAAALGVNGPALGALLAAEHFASGLVTPALFAYMMDLTDPAIAGSQYALLATIELLPKGLVGALAGAGARLVGIPQFMVLAGVVALLPLFVLPFVRRPSPAVAPVLQPDSA